MKHAIIHSCTIGPTISEEQFIPEHFFLYLVAGSMLAYDGNREYKIKPGDYGIARRNYKFNVTLERFAFLTGRSLSAFKREFQQTFNNTPGSWLMEKRLREAHFQITQKGQKPSDIYLDLGFEDLSHFSFAFKKLFGHAPSKF